MQTQQRSMSSPPSKRRREGIFLACLPALVVALVVGWGSKAVGMGKDDAIQLAILKIDGVSCAGRPNALSRLMAEVTRRTSTKVEMQTKVVTLAEPTLFLYPLLFLCGESAFSSLAETDVLRLRNFLAGGGTLVIDRSADTADKGFDRSARALVAQIFPKHPLEKLSSNHSVYRSFYLTRLFGGRVIESTFLEGVTRDDRTPILYSMNDLLGAWERDAFGQWTYPVVPGGEGQREQAFRLGVNLVMYALCVNYKQDLVHAPEIMRRKRR